MNLCFFPALGALGGGLCAADAAGIFAMIAQRKRSPAAGLLARPRARRFGRAPALALALAAFGAWAPPGQAASRALLVGVGDYQAPVDALAGPPHDVRAMRDALIGRFAFDAGNVTTLVDAAATRAGILEALERLSGELESGDFLLLYFSGHGTSAFDPAFRDLDLLHTTGAFVPWDYDHAGAVEEKRNTLLIGRRDLRPLLTAIDRKGVSGLILIDSCFSENSARSAFADDAPAYRQVTSGLEHLGAFAASPVSERERYPYRNLATIAASSKKEKALDLGYAFTHLTHDGQPHGAFTDSLLRTLGRFGAADSNRDGEVSNGELFAAVKEAMAAANLSHSPQFLPAPGEDAGLAESRAFQHAELAPPDEPKAEPMRIFAGGRWPVIGQLVAQSPDLAAGSERAYDLRVARKAGAIHLLTPFGDSVMQGRSERTVADALREQPWIRGLTQGANTAQSFGIDLRFDDHQGETFEAGDELSFAATARQDAFFLVVAIAPDGSFRILFPDSRQAFGLVPAGTSTWFRARVNEPFGMDYVVAAAFIEAPPFYDGRLIESDAISPGSRLHGLLRRTLMAGGEGQARAVAKVVTVPRIRVAKGEQ